MGQNNMNLGNFKVGEYSKPYIIAEIGVNHEGCFERAKTLIDLAKKGGANAAKFQSYKADTLTSKDSPAYWDLRKEPTTSQHKLFKKYDNFSVEQYIELSKYCKSIGIEFLSTPFDDNSIDFLEPLMPFYKIASADITNLPFLRKIAKKGKPIVLSTGASTLEEIDYALKILQNKGCNEIAILHCILNYPTIDKNANLAMISSLKESYPEYVVGYSDHTMPDENMTTLVTAYLLGSKIIEKHFTDDKSLPGNDHYHSMDVYDLKKFNYIVNKIDSLIGCSEFKSPIETEDISIKNARRSIVAKNSIKVNSIIREDDITYKRPGVGISTVYWDTVIGGKAKCDIKKDQIILWDMLEVVK